ncbi:MAG: pyruvate formate lyase family protein, partial [Armatimonadota bacterium]
MTPRVARLRDEIMGRKGSFVENDNPMVLQVAIYRAMQKHGSRVQLRANMLLEQVRLASIEIKPEWRIAGEHLPRASKWFIDTPDISDPKIREWLSLLGVCEDEYTQVAALVDEWKKPVRVQSLGDADADRFNGIASLAEPCSTGVYMPGGWTENHSIRDYAKVLRLGFSGIKKEVEGYHQSLPVSDPDFSRKEHFWKAAIVVCEAGELLGQRYSEYAHQMAKTATDNTDRERLEFIADTCAHVPANGARTFFEATQALWFAHVLTCGEDSINANSIGRLDQILWPYYDADIKAGRLTREESVDIMEEFACKLYLEYDVQAITLGGLDCDGNSAVNELSYVILDATENLGIIRDLSVRLSSRTPDPFLLRTAELIQRGGGIPFIFNDDCFVGALADRGIAIEDARDYAPIGCIELTVPGKANPHAVSGWINVLKCLELAIFDGCDPRTGKQVGPSTGALASMQSFEEFYKAYCDQVRFFSERMVYHCNRGELLQRETGPLPCWSLLTDDCIARGRDITDEGAIYNYHSICFMGMANTADSLLTLKNLVFDEKTVASGELLNALRADFDGYDSLRQFILHRVPKYGNDEDEVDKLAQRVADDFIDLMDTMRSPLNGRYFVHLFTFKLN